jgi:hypothetical protein
LLVDAGREDLGHPEGQRKMGEQSLSLAEVTLW